MKNPLKALGESANSNKYLYERPDLQVLETFPCPDNQGTMSIHIEVPEFTSLCPRTGQPDFATIIIDYVPDQRCIESKSLKLYLMRYRNHGAFHEECTAQILNDLVEACDPLELTLKGEFTPRGGIPFHPTVKYVKAPVFRERGGGNPAHQPEGPKQPPVTYE